MIKHVSINRFEGTGIIERIEGNGWDIELNGVNARIIEDLESRSISLNGPAVEDLFKSLRDLLKENGGLRETIEGQDACINRLEHNLKEKNAVIKDLQFYRENYEERCKILDEAVKEKNKHIKTLQKELKDKDAEVDEFNNKLEKYDSTKEIIKWLYGEIKNNTDYATKIFDKESKKNVFSITFCKVPVEPEVVTNEQG